MSVNFDTCIPLSINSYCKRCASHSIHTLMEGPVTDYGSNNLQSHHTHKIEELAPTELFTRKPLPSLLAAQVITVAVVPGLCQTYLCLVHLVNVTSRLKYPCCYIATDIQPKELRSVSDLVLRLLRDVMTCCSSCSKDVRAP